MELTKEKSSLKQSVVLAEGKLKKKKGYNVWYILHASCAHSSIRQGAG
jgi:hypothetical protein